MAMFTKPQEYLVKAQIIRMRDFHDRRGLYVTRPPYQRKVAWTTTNQRHLLDSIFRGYYIPKLVLRQITVDNETKHEVIDGQQRITVLQRFFDDTMSLPESLRDVRADLPGKTYSQLPKDVRDFLDYEQFDVDMVYGLEDPRNSRYQKIATDIFRRLQEGESLNYMEKAHARLDSLARNFLVKYADDIAFDYCNYVPLEENVNKHPFFRNVYRGKNDRMQHLAFLARLLVFEMKNGPSDIREREITDLLADTEVPNGIGDESYETRQVAKKVLANLDYVHSIVKVDPDVLSGNGIIQMETEYFALSFYLLIRHLRLNYVLEGSHLSLLYDFLVDFHERWKWHRHEEEHRDLLSFAENRQQSRANIETRDQIMRQLFFEFLDRKEISLTAKDPKRRFSEAERIRIYRRDRGICRFCVDEGRSPEAAFVPWSQFEADHVLPHSKGGETTIENGQVLCRQHNRSKGAAS